MNVPGGICKLDAMQQPPLVLFVLLAVATCSGALAPESSQWAVDRGVKGAPALQPWAFVAPQVQSTALGAAAGQRRPDVGNACMSARRRVLHQSVLRMTDTGRKTVQDARSAACRAIRSALAAAGVPMDRRDDEQVESSRAKVDEFLLEVGREVNAWVKEVQGTEDARVDEIGDSLDAVSEQLNRGSSLQWGERASPSDRNVTMRFSRKQMVRDPSTKNLLISIERIRRRYEQGVYQMTDKVRPWTQQEIVDAVQSVSDTITGEVNSLSKLSGDWESTTESLTEVIKPLSTEEVEAFTSEVDVRWKDVVQAAEEELRAGVERARYQLRRRTKFRTVEEEAAVCVCVCVCVCARAAQILKMCSLQ